MRLDKYLKLSRIIKRRTIANELCDNCKVTVNGKIVKAHYDVNLNDYIVIQYGDKTIEHTVELIPYEPKSKNQKK